MSGPRRRYTRQRGKGMNKRTATWIWIVATAVLVVAIIFADLFAPTGNAGFKDEAAALAFVSGAAIAIERVIEAFWTFLGGWLGSYWPLSAITKQVDTLVGELDTALKPFHEDLEKQLEALAQSGKIGKERL